MSLDCGRKLEYLKRTLGGGGIQTPHGKAPAGGLLSVTVLTNTHTHTQSKKTSMMIKFTFFPYMSV